MLQRVFSPWGLNNNDYKVQYFYYPILYLKWPHLKCHNFDLLPISSNNSLISTIEIDFPIHTGQFPEILTLEKSND